MRLIDADALSEKLCETTIFIKDGEMFQRMINNAPTIEPDGDLISRRDAIKATCNAVCECDVPHYPNCDQIKYCDEIQALISLPSAESTGAMDEAIQKYIKDGYMQPIGEDLISRKDAIDVLAKFVPYAICDESTESYTNGLKDAYNLICQLPSAESKTGECETCKRNADNGVFNDEPECLRVRAEYNKAKGGDAHDD